MHQISRYIGVGLFLLMTVTSVFSSKYSVIPFPKAKEIVTRALTTEEEKDDSNGTIVYCAPSRDGKDNCQWKGVKRQEDSKQQVVVEEHEVEESSKPGHACIFTLKNGSKIDAILDSDSAFMDNTASGHMYCPKAKEFVVKRRTEENMAISVYCAPSRDKRISCQWQGIYPESSQGPSSIDETQLPEQESIFTLKDGSTIVMHPSRRETKVVYKSGHVIPAPKNIGSLPFLIHETGKDANTGAYLTDDNAENVPGFEKCLDKTFLYAPAETRDEKYTFPNRGDFTKNTKALEEYAGRVFLPPVSTYHFGPQSVVELGDTLKKLRMLIIVKSNGGTIWEGQYLTVMLEYIVNKNDTINEVLTPIIKSLNGENVFSEKIAKPNWDKLKRDARISQGKLPWLWITGMDMADYSMPWYKPSLYHKGSDGFVNEGRKMERNQSYEQNKIQDDEVLVFHLYRQGNHLTSYGHAGKFDTKEFWTDMLLDTVGDLVSELA